MKVIQPSFEINCPISRDEGVNLLRYIERCARISHRSEDAQTPDSYDRFLRAVVLQKGDWSVCEHASASVTIRTDRGITHELVRHRLFSYTQESTRFVNYGKREIEFIEPSWTEKKINPTYEWQAMMSVAESTYLALLEQGQPPQAARSTLPNALASTIVMTGNLRNWRHLFMMRTTKETHPDMKRITIPLLAAFQERIPILYEDIVPDQKQSVSLARAK